MGLHLTVWTPVAAAHAAAFYLNRILRKAAAEFSWTAAVLIVAMLVAETPRQYLGVALLIFAVPLFELGFRTRLREFRYQAYGASLLGAGAALFLNVIGPDSNWKWQWLPIAIATLVSYATAIRVRKSETDRMGDEEATTLRRAGSVAAAVFSLALVWKLAPGDYLGLAWIALGAMLFELSLRGLPS